MAAIETAIGKVGIVERGSGGTPLILLHGVGSDKSVWDPQLEAFGGQRRTIALDYPGYGESELWPEARRDDFARAVLAALDALAIPRAHICGLSLGGVVAIAISAIAPERCASLILADSFAAHPDGAGIYHRSIEASRTTGMRGLAEARAGILLGAAASADLRASVIATMGRIDPAAYAIGARAVWLADQTDRASAIHAPTLVLVGEEDRVTPPALSEQLAALIAGSHLVVLPSAGHLSNAEQPEPFNRAIAEFLSEIDPI